MNTFDFEDEQESEEEEAGPLEPKQIAQAVLWGTDWTTETILSQLAQENIYLNPRFQRRDAWSLARKSRFIESLILGLPIPQIVLAERRNKRGKFIVLDGKQRLLTLLQFVGNAKESKYNGFKLSGLEVRDDLNGSSYADLQSGMMIGELAAFRNSTIRAVIIRNWPNTSLLHLIFHRLNTGSVTLSPQELRQALFPGRFLNYMYDRAEQSVMLRKLLNISEPDFRMRDVELLVRYEGFKFFLPSYAGNLRVFLDDTCDRLNAEWDDRQGEIEQSIDEYEGAIAAMIEIFGEENIARKWTGKEFEKRPNRAVLDIMAFYFSNREIQAAAKKKKKQVVTTFKTLCETNTNFRKSIETTTKSLTATFDRFYFWGKVLKEVLAINIELPKFNKETDRIEFNAI